MNGFKTTSPLLFLASLGLLCSCAVLHHVQFGEIDNRNSVSHKPIEMKVSEVGIDLNDARLATKLMLNKNSGKAANDALAILGLFQMGPRTGAGVYSLGYINDIDKILRQECPNGHISSIENIRETRKYPVISGEIIKIKADCVTPKGKS